MKTARYLNPNISNEKHLPLRISLGAPKFALPYRLTADFRVIAPTTEILQIDDKDRYRREYRRYLDGIDVITIQNALNPFRSDEKEIVLLCFEDLRIPCEWCHRRFFAEWWEEKTGERVHELEEPALELAAKNETKQMTLF